jgi:general secretion pathway protein G
MLKKKGFTLIELLIVVAIISILIGIALPRFRGMQEEGNIARAKGELRTIQTAVESYYMHNSRAYPTALTNLTGQSPNVISSLPDDPFNGGNSYGYAQSANSNYYVAYSIGPDANGAAAIANTGVITETNGASCIYISNAGQDSQP